MLKDNEQAPEDQELDDNVVLDLTKGPDNPNPDLEQQLEDDIPDKFKGKSLTDIVKSYQNIESELGRARNEVGTVRRLADELLGMTRASIQSKQEKPTESPKLTADDIFSDPTGSVLKIVENSAEQRDRAHSDRMSRLEGELALARFERKHTDYQSTMQDPKFSEWVQKSALRLALAQGAVQGNIAAADELFTLYKETVPVAEKQDEPDQITRARKASLTRPAGASIAGGGKPNDAGKKIWKRSELMDMRINNPDEFDRLQPEILKAYAEKRVR